MPEKFAFFYCKDSGDEFFLTLITYKKKKNKKKLILVGCVILPRTSFNWWFRLTTELKEKCEYLKLYELNSKLN